MRSSYWFSASVLSVVVAFGLAGCGGKDDKATGKDGKKAAEAEHAHPTDGPHGGHLIELGNEEYHAELAHDDKTHTVSIYLLDATAKKAVPIDAKEVKVNLVVGGKPSQYSLPAKPLEGEPAGQSSRFELADEAFMEALEAKTTKGRLSVTISGKDFSGAIEHHEHDDEHKK